MDPISAAASVGTLIVAIVAAWIALSQLRSSSRDAHASRMAEMSWQIYQAYTDPLIRDAAPPSAPAPEPAAPAPDVPTPAAYSVVVEQLIRQYELLIARLQALAAQTAAERTEVQRTLEAVQHTLQQNEQTITQLQASPLVADHAQAQRLERTHTGLLATFTGLAGALALRTVEALYDGWVQVNLLPLLPDWVQRPWAGYLQGSRPVSPLPAPAQPASPVSRPGAVRQQPVSERRVDVPLPELVRVPAGWFLMGSDKKRDPDAQDDELPQHRVWLDEYWMGRYRSRSTSSLRS